MTSLLARNERRAFGASWMFCGSLFALAVSIYCIWEQRHSEELRSVTALLPGITIGQLPQPEAGLVVTSLQTNGEAERGGVAVGDRVTAIDQHAVLYLGDAEELIRHNGSKTMAVRLLHNHTPHDVVLHRSEEIGHGT